jgi:hydroxymethylpyrimidine kinase/phosphomethylpyrimidine kinase
VTPPVALTIAGSDSGGGAGIQADLKTFHAFGVFGTSALTAVTAQNTVGVRAVHVVPADTVRAQIEAVVEDLRPVACKTGMLATRALVETVGAALAAAGLGNYVLDPVMVATSGDRLLDEDGEGAIARVLLPRCTLITPNLDEAAILAGFDVHGVADMERAARALVAAGAGAALVKGGHLAGGAVVDVLYDGRTLRRYERPRIATRAMHGTGCTLSAAVAAGLAHGRALGAAVEAALEYVQRAIRTAPPLGRGSGPLNHLAPAPAPPAHPPATSPAG